MPRRRTHSRRSMLAVVGATALLPTAGCIEELENATNTPSVAEVKDRAEQVDPNTLYRNIDEYEGSYVHFPQLHLSDVVEGEGDKEYILTVPGIGFGDTKPIYGYWDGNPFRDGDSVEIWGKVLGLKTYTSLTGEQTVPELDIREMELLEQ